MRRTFHLGTLVCIVTSGLLLGQSDKSTIRGTGQVAGPDRPPAPELVSVFSFGGQQGAEFRATIRGRSLDRISPVWFDCEQLSATIVSVEDDKSAGPAAASRKKKSSSTDPYSC